MRLMKETEQYSVDSLHMLVETTAATLGLLLAAGEHEAVVWLCQRFQEMVVTSLKHLGADVDEGLKVKLHDN